MVAMNVWPTDAADGSVASEARWRKMARYWTMTGVLAGQGADMVPTLAYPNLTVKAGACWVDGHYCELSGEQVLAVTANGLTVVRFDPAANTAQLLYLDGVTVPSQSPTGTYELPIAKIVGSALQDVRPVVTAAGSPGVPRGRVATNIVTTAQAGFGTGGAAISTAITYTFDVTRWVEIAASIPVAIGATATVANALLAVSGGVGTLVSGGVALRGDGGVGYIFLRWQGFVASGSKSVTVTLSSNVGTVSHSASASSPSMLSIVDLGI